MPNWGDDEGRYWWTPPGKMWYDRIEVPHPPVITEKNCKCDFCIHERAEKKKAIKQREKENLLYNLHNRSRDVG